MNKFFIKILDRKKKIKGAKARMIVDTNKDNCGLIRLRCIQAIIIEAFIKINGIICIGENFRLRLSAIIIKLEKN